VQKPFAPSWEDAVAIVDAAEAAGVWLAVHENFRFEAPMRHVRRLIDSGAIGTPSWARISFRTGYDIYRTQPYLYDEEHFVIADVGIHVLDLARFLMGEVERLSCETQRRNPKVRAEDTATMLVRHAGGAVSVVECTYEARRSPDIFPETTVEVEGDRGSVVTLPGCWARVTSQNLVWEEDIGAPLLPWTSRPWHVSQEGAHGACRHFLARLQAGEPAETSGADNLRTFALVDAAYVAAETGRAVAPRAREPRPA
jgi:predicted dehydrogenase